MQIIKTPQLDLAKIAASGQCFLWENPAPGTFVIPAFGKILTAVQLEDGIELDCSEEEKNIFWNDYFDIDFNYEVCYNVAVSCDLPYLGNSARYSSGIRILKQELWETALSFIISQNNNIPRIRGCLKRITERYGRLPDPGEITPDGLQGLGLGYRDSYIVNAAEHFKSRDFTDALKAQTYENAKKQLLAIKGIGNKVADCICLYGLGHKSAFPRDVWIRRVEKEHFNGHFPDERFDGYAGVLQQYLFYYGRSFK
ncbi:MAG: 8-oxoguanine DNA glycosylase [Oscillospiraceae bacterium]|jgi:N-glycosylase/DNA lyase|nr:8-oxoguanine DNA glycosylase [Oscillospiraceae bacterium]